MVATSVISLSSLSSIFSAMLVQLLDDAVDGLLDAAGQGHRVGAGGERLEAFAVDGLGEDGGGGGAVAGDVAGLAGGFLDELGAHVLVGVSQLDLLGDGDAVLGDGRAAPALVDDGVAAARPEGACDGPGQLGDAGEQLLAGLVTVRQLLGSHPRISFRCQSTTVRITKLAGQDSAPDSFYSDEVLIEGIPGNLPLEARVTSKVCAVPSE